MSFKRTVATLFTAALIPLMFAGCSLDSSVGLPRNDSANPAAGGRIQISGEPVQFSACVATANYEMRMLTFEGIPDTIIAAENCIIVRLKNDTEAPIPFSDIHKGDSLAINGTQQQARKIIAHRIQLQTQTDGSYDLAFRDTVTTIDYSAGSFTVANHAQTILVDSNTLIWGNLLGHSFQYSEDANIQHMHSNGAKMSPNLGTDTILSFSDLQVGNILEIRADIVDSVTLLAVSIKLVNCQDQPRCVRFEAHLALVDAPARIITFTENPWIGKVCNGAQLLGLDGEKLTLADFTAGDYVAVKGVPLAGDTLKISQVLMIAE